MDYVKFGRTGLRISPYALGTTNFGVVIEEADAHRKSRLYAVHLPSQV